MQKSKFIHMILYLCKNMDVLQCYNLIKSVFNKDKNHYCCNRFLEQCSYK